VNLEERAIKFIKTVANATDKELFSGNSGGKDSAIVDYLLQESGIKYHSYYTNTTIDPAGTLGHLRKLYPHTEILQPKESFYQLVERKGLPTRLNRYCCEFLKEYGSVGKIVFEGVRSAESRGRQNRDYVQCDNRKWQKGAQHVYPIYDWTDDDVWNFIEEKKIVLAPAYSNGLNRLGCVGCPQVSRKGAREKEFALYPRYYEAIKRAIARGMAKNPQWKLTVATGGDGELAMRWWLSGKTMNDYFGGGFEKTETGWNKV
jgi:phosphoadenosine phosphosulfate reductase